MVYTVEVTLVTAAAKINVCDANILYELGCLLYLFNFHCFSFIIKINKWLEKCKVNIVYNTKKCGIANNPAIISPL